MMVESDFRISGSIIFIGFNIFSYSLRKFRVRRITRKQELQEYEVKTNETVTTPNVGMTSPLSPSQIEEFKTRGVLVIKNFLSVDEVANARRGFHQYLLDRGIDPRNLEDTANKLSILSSTGGSGGVIDVFYQDWKLTLNENPRAVAIMTALWGETFAKCQSPYNHPYGKFNSKEALMYIDRVCYRVPDRISEMHCSDGNKKRFLQRSLTPHIDCCPHKMFQDVGEHKYNKWRPIQSFIALTDTPCKNMGGFEACPGLHLEFDEWTKKRIPNPVKQNKRILKQKVRSKKCNEKRNFDTENCSTNLHTDKNGLILQKYINEEEIVTDVDINGDVMVEPVVSTDSDPESHKWDHPPCVGQFTPIRMIEDSDIINRFEHIPCSAGDLILWDYRIPHSNSYKNTSDTTREAIYLGFLPNIMLNKEYIKDQLIRFYQGIVPCDQWHSHNQPQVCNYSFSSLGKKLMGIEPWI